jgi:hypothetical protein
VSEESRYEMPQRFTVAQAEALLPAVEQGIRDALELKRFFDESNAVLEQETRRIMMSGGAMVNASRLEAEKSRRDTCAVKLNSAIEHVQSFGCEVKDLDIGLLDFRCWYRGEEVYLCWKLGETGITHWHGLTEGFRGRKAIDAAFLREHRGDPVA